MAGYERKTLALKFEDEELEGLVVRMKRLPIGDLFGVTELADLGDDIKANKEAFDELLSTVADNLISWNLEQGGKPVPAVKGYPAHKAAPGCCDLATGVLTYTDEAGPVVGGVVPNATPGARHPSTGLYSVDVDLVMMIVEAWVDAASGVSRPLPKTSNSSGSSALERFEAMEALSMSRLPSELLEPSSASWSGSPATP